MKNNPHPTWETVDGTGFIQGRLLAHRAGSIGFHVAWLVPLIALLAVTGLFGSSAGQVQAASVGISLPFAAGTGTWKVTSGYNNGDHHTGSNKYDLDLQRNSGTTANTTVLSPVSGTFSNTFTCYTGGVTAGYGINIRVDNVMVGTKYLFVQVCHLAAAPATGHVDRGASLGTIYDSGAASSHVHIGLFAADFNSTDSGRTAVAFDGDYALDGRVLPATTVTNAYQCGGSYIPTCDLQSSQGATSYVKASITSPAPGSTLGGSTVTFSWNSGSGVTAYFLYVGTSQGASDKFGNWVSGGSQAVSGLPTDGSTAWVRLWSYFPTGWQFNDYSFRTASPVTVSKAAITSPAPGSTLGGSTVTFSWNSGSGVTAYFLYVGTSQGASDKFGNWVSGGSQAVSGLPTDGSTIWVRLWSYFPTGWQSNDYTFRAASNVVSRSEVVVDETSGQFSRGGSYWQNSTIGYGGHAFWTYVNGSVVDSWGEWQATLAGGNYEVFVFVPRNNATTQQARYDISYSGGTASRTVNQNAYYDAWVSLGTYNFSSGTAKRLRLTDATGESGTSLRKIAFDAVKFVPR